MQKSIILSAVLLLMTAPAIADTTDAAKYSKADRAAMTRLVKHIEADAKMPDILKGAWDAAVNREIERRKGKR